MNAEGTEPAPIDLASRLEPFRAEGKIPGLVALILRGDRIVAEGAVGVRKQGAPERVTLGDRFHLGSCTKAMTATLAAMLVDDGKLEWTATLGELFGTSIREMHPGWKHVTLQQVLAHRAGFRDPGAVGAVFGAYGSRSSNEPLPEQRRKIAAHFLSHPPATPPGTQYVYSNIGYVVVGAALERITGKSWEDLMRVRLFQPLGITSGGFGASASIGKIDEPWGHEAASGRAIDPGSRDADLPPAIGPAGIAHMTIIDWAKFVSLHLRGDPANPNHRGTLLNPQTFFFLHRPLPGEKYAAGWVIGSGAWAKGHRAGDEGLVLYHGGDDESFHCETLIAPEIDFAVLVMCNRSSDDRDPECAKALHALRLEFATEPGNPARLRSQS